MTLPFRRRTDSWATPHERARVRAAERMDGPLEPDESTWLDNHLAACDACQASAEAYEADRSELRGLRRTDIAAPRDLWARTSAAIEHEARTSRRKRGTPLLRRVRPSPVPLGALSGLMVVAVVVGATMLSGRPVPSVAPATEAPVVAVTQRPETASSAPLPTPWRANGEVEWLAVGDTGTLDIYTESYSEVCPDNGAECAPLDDATPRTEVMVDSDPEQAILSPDDKSLVVVGAETGGGNTVLVVPVPADTSGGPSAGPSATPTPTPTRSAIASPSDGVDTSGSPSPPPATSSTPSGSPASSTPPSTEPSTEPSAEPPTDRPTDGSTDPPTLTPESPAPGGPQAIADDVVLVGSTAFNADGTLFAFSARPADGSHGPDIFVWRQGDARATAVTDNHGSVFSGWLGDLVLGSRALDPLAATTRSEAFVIDPADGTESVVDLGSVWRPVVDPEGRFAVYWQGTIELADDGVEWLPDEGRLVVAPWPGTPRLAALPDATGAPGANPPPSIIGASSSSPEASVAPERDVDVLVDDAVREWEARWNETGTHLAVWVADDDDPEIGRLALYGVDARTDRIVPDRPLMSGELARPGFAIGDGNLAWATPPDGQDGKGPHVKVVAWTTDGIGKVETKPAGDVLVVQR